MWYLRCTCNQHWRESQWRHRRRQKSHCRRTHHKRWNCGLRETIVGWWKIVLRFFPISSKFKIRSTLFFLYTSSPLVNGHSNKRTPSINGQILLHHNKHPYRSFLKLIKKSNSRHYNFFNIEWIFKIIFLWKHKYWVDKFKLKYFKFRDVV